MTLLAEFIQAAIPAQEAIQNLWLAVKWSPDEQASVDELRPLAASVEERFRQLRAVYHRLQLVASPPLRDKAEHITYAADEFRWWVINGNHGGTIQYSTLPWQLVLDFETIEDFVNHARRELGSESWIDRARRWIGQAILWARRRLGRSGSTEAE